MIIPFCCYELHVSKLYVLEKCDILLKPCDVSILYVFLCIFLFWTLQSSLLSISRIVSGVFEIGSDSQTGRWIETMPRDYTPDPRGKRYQKIDPVVIEKAKDILTKGISYREAATKYNINYSVLYRHVKRNNIKLHGGQTALTTMEENLILERILKCAEWG